MRSTLFLFGSVLVVFSSVINAAPKAKEDEGLSPTERVELWKANQPNASGKWPRALRSRYVRGRSLPIYNNNTTIPVPSTSTHVDNYPGGGGTSTAPNAPGSTDCPLDVVISTTTLQVTVYVTEGNDKSTLAHNSTLPPVTWSTPTLGNQTVTGTLSYGGQETQHPSLGNLYTPPHTTTMEGTTRDYYQPGTVVYGNSTGAFTSTLAEYPEGSATTRFTTARFWNTTSATATLYTSFHETSASEVGPGPTESCVIDTTIVPVTTATLTGAPSETGVPTKTVSEDTIATGKPDTGTIHCGVHGLPVGNYFIARFVENSAGVPVTLEGCYQFCNSVMDATEGCQSYRFYPERGINAPRCDLYGSPVAYALDRIDERHVDTWFDLECGSPRSERWASLPGLARLAELGLQ